MKIINFLCSITFLLFLSGIVLTAGCETVAQIAKFGIITILLGGLTLLLQGVKNARR